MEVILLLLRLCLVGVFGVAGFAKFFDPEGSGKAFTEFGVPKVFARPLVYLLPAAEILIAVALLFVDVSWFGAIGAVALLSIFSGGMLYQMAKGNAPDCHCFGQLHSEPVGVSSVLRNVALLALAIFLAVQGRTSQGLSLANTDQDVMQFVMGIAVVALLGAVVFFLKRISDQQTQIMRRIELMELVSRDGDAVEREDVGHPHEGLPIGAQFPDFALPDLAGKPVSLDMLLADGKPALFMFISPTCNPCKALLPEFKEWQAQLSERVNFIFVSGGTAEANIEKFGSDSGMKILLQQEREVAESVRAKWTPTAIMMDGEGRISSHAAAGDTAIRTLIEQIKKEDIGKEFTYFASIDGHTHANKIGSDAPNFQLKDVKGREITTDYFKGKQTLVTFWSLTCGYCQGMLDDLREWDKSKGMDEPNLIVFSDGDTAANEQLGLESPVIVDDGHKTSAGFGMFGTPSAVLVNEDGKIVSETAIGAPDIWSLIGKSL